MSYEVVKMEKGGRYIRCVSCGSIIDRAEETAMSHDGEHWLHSICFFTILRCHMMVNTKPESSN